MAGSDYMAQASGAEPSVTSGDLVPSEVLDQVLNMPAVNLVSPAKSNIDSLEESTSVPSQSDTSTIEGSVDFIDATDQALTNLTNPAAVAGLSTKAPELIGSFDFVPLYPSDSDIPHQSVFNAIHMNVMLDSLTREAAKNCLNKILQNDGNVTDTLISSLQPSSFNTYSEFLDAFGNIARYAFFVQKLYGVNFGWDDLYSAFDAMRSALKSRFSIDASQSTWEEMAGAGHSGASAVADTQGYLWAVSGGSGSDELSTGHISKQDHMSDLVNVSNKNEISDTAFIGQIIQDLRRSVLLISPQMRDGDRDGEDVSTDGAYSVRDDMNDTDSFVNKMIMGLNALNTSSDIEATVTSQVEQILMLSQDDYLTFTSNLLGPDAGTSGAQDLISICHLITRDVYMSFMKRTTAVLYDAYKALDAQSIGTNPSVELLVNETIGNIGGSLSTSTPASESIASLLNPVSDATGGERTFTFERFSIDSSFGLNARAGFDVFSGDLFDMLKTPLLLRSAAILDFSFGVFADDFTRKAQSIAQMVPILIGGAKGSNSLWKATTTLLADYLLGQNFTEVGSDLAFHDISSDAWEDALGGYGDWSGEQDEYEFIRLGIFGHAIDSEEIGYLLTRYLDLRHLLKVMDASWESKMSGSEILDEGSVETEFEENYEQFYVIAKELAEKVTEVLGVTSYGDFTGAIDEASYDVSSAQSVSFKPSGFMTSEEKKSYAISELDVMETPIGIALLTSVSSSESIFDLPYRVLASFYDTLLNEAFVSDEGDRVSSTDLTEDDNTRVSAAKALMSAGLEKLEITTDYRGWSDTLRRRAITHMIATLIDRFIDPNLWVYSSAVVTDAAVGPMPGARGGEDFTILGQNVSAQIFTQIYLIIDSMKVTQFTAIVRDMNDLGYGGGGYVIYDDVIDLLKSLDDGGAFEETEGSIKYVHTQLLNEYAKTESYCEALKIVGETLKNEYDAVSATIVGQGVSNLVSLVELAASNAISNSDNPVASTLTSDDAFSAILSTAMFPETLSAKTVAKECSRYVSSGGYYDSEISSGEQNAAVDLLIPSSEVIPANRLSQRIIPSLKLMTAQGREQTTGEKSDPISVKGDPDNDRKEILAVGLPPGLTERLREEAAVFSSGGYSPEDYEQSPLVCIKVWKKDLDRGDVVYKPQNYVFDTRVYPSVYDGWDGGNTTSKIVAKGIGASAKLSETDFGEPVYTIDTSTEDVSLDWETLMSTRGMSTVEYSDPSQFVDLYDDLRFRLILRSPLRGTSYGWVQESGSLNDIFESSSADEIKKNHLQDYLLSQYLRVVAGVNVENVAFQLFKKGTSTMATGDGAGLGTGADDFSFISDILSMNPSFSDDFRDGDYIKNVRSDILSMIDKGITDDIISNFGVSSTISKNVTSKISQSLLFSPEKYFNRHVLPRLFERVFCILIDPDGFDIDTDETTGIDTSDDNVLAAYKSEIFNFYVTVEILPVQSGDGFETSAD